MRIIKTIYEYPAIEDIFESVKDEPEVAFLDSSLRNDLGKYSVLAFRPYLRLVNGVAIHPSVSVSAENDSVITENDSVITENDSLFTINGEVCDTPFHEYLKNYLQEHEEENPTDLPLVDGAIGYLSYEYGRKKEGIVTKHEKTVDIPDCVLNFYDIFIVEDHKKQELTLVANGKCQDAKATMQELELLIEKVLATKSNLEESTLVAGIETNENNWDLDASATVTADFNQEDYMQAVDNMIHYIVEGDVYVINMTHQLQVQSACKPAEFFSRLRTNNPSPFGGYLNYGDFQIVCASPERFLQMKNRHVNTRPIKGTRKRGETPEEDERLKQELAASEKDQSELLMIVDLERNDLNRVCVPGSVKVTELFEVETYATVFHLISNVEGTLLDTLNVADLIEATFPGGSITGAPKFRAMELIDEQERSRRNLYTGSIGYISLNGDCDFNIVIRTAVHKDGVYHIGVGGGITYESDLEFEYEETWQKARALLDALGAKRI